MKKILWVLSIIFILIDQAIKLIVSNSIKLNTDIKIINKLFYITNVHNDGAAFSMLSGNVIFLILVTLVALVIIYLFFIKDKELSKIDVILYSMLIGGIIGNFIDRIIHRYVIDYIGVIIGTYYFPIFNFADICIVLSIIGIILLSFKEDACKSTKLKKTKVE